MTRFRSPAQAIQASAKALVGELTSGTQKPEVGGQSPALPHLFRMPAAHVDAGWRARKRLPPKRKLLPEKSGERKDSDGAARSVAGHRAAFDFLQLLGDDDAAGLASRRSRLINLSQDFQRKGLV